MIEYLIKSSLGLALILALYYVLLEKEKIYRFNRFYLLFGLAFSFLVPLITITVYEQAQVFVESPIVKNLDRIASLDNRPTIESPKPQQVTVIESLIYIYGTITTYFLIRFIKNIGVIILTVNRSKTISYQGATLVLTKNTSISHTFLNYIFINEDEYQTKSIEPELLAHELTHVRQKHSLDIILIEIVFILFWFNPIVILYKRAIQLNHEFLADEKVLSIYQNIKNYQILLLSKIGRTNIMPLANSFNYIITKKRLIMMTENFNKTRSVCKKLALLPLIAVGVFALSTRVVATIPVKLTTEATSAFKTQKPTINPTSDKSLNPKPSDKSINKLKVPRENSELITTRPQEGSLQNEAIQAADQVRIRPTFVELMPEFLGGMNKFKEFISKNTVHNGVSGTIETSFQVDKDGSIITFPLPNNDENNENSVLEAIKKCPKWKPAVQNGYPLMVTYIMTVSFSTVDGTQHVQVDKLAAINEKMIVSFEKNSQAKKILVQGTILNKAGNPLRGASIATANYKNGAISDKEGKFLIDLTNPEPLTISYIGYSTERINP